MYTYFRSKHANCSALEESIDTKHTAHKLYVCIQVTYHHYNIRRESITIIERKNQRAAEKWKAMSEEDKKQYIDAAKVAPADMPTDSWGEAHRILRNIQKSVCGVYI